MVYLTRVLGISRWLRLVSPCLMFDMSNLNVKTEMFDIAHQSKLKQRVDSELGCEISTNALVPRCRFPAKQPL